MSSSRHLFTQWFALGLAVLAGNYALVSAARGQSAADREAACAAYASVPLPAAAEQTPAPKTPPPCASYRSYRGIGRPVNYAEARACAWRERLAQNADLGQNEEQPTAWVVGGSLILADIYFNGAGVKRDIPLAIRFACESEEGMARLALPEITKLNGSLPSRKPFEFCDYASTTLTMNFCSDYESQLAEERRIRYYNSLKSSMTVEQRLTFEKLLAAQTAYVNAHALEVDQSGSIHAIRTIGSQGILKDQFHAELVHFEHKKWPVLSAHQVKTADALLQREYEKKLQQVRSHAQQEPDPGAVTDTSLSRVEGQWQTFRDAWVAFALLRYPAVAEAVRAEITLDRYRLLRTIQ